MSKITIADLATDYEEAGGYLRRKDASPAKPSPVLSVQEVLRTAVAELADRAPDPEKEAMARVCEAAADHEVIRKRSSHYVEYEASKRVLQDALADLERARGKGEG